MRLATLEGKRVAVWGYGREGRAALAALQRHLPHQPLTLWCSAGEAADLAHAKSITVHTDAPDAESLATFDFVIKSPGVSAYKPEIRLARERGTVFTSGTALWFGENPRAHVIGITGTKGKSTTAAMTAHIARALGRRTALAGNIGLPLLELDGRDAELWVIELSSFQTGEAGPLDVGVVLNLYEEHLDWHGTRERYFADKLKLADVARTLVVDATQDELLARTASHPQRTLFGASGGWCARDGSLYRGDVAFGPAPHVSGAHNVRNACAALAALDALYAFDADSARAAVRALADFTPLPHRLQDLGERDGVRWINDSISTTPQASLAALTSLRGASVILLVGGYDRGVDWAGFAVSVTDWPNLHIIAQGANGPRIVAALDAAQCGVLVQRVPDLAAAVAAARRLASPGSVIVLSPGAPSFDAFHDYAERGRRFADLAGFGARALGTIAGLGIA